MSHNYCAVSKHDWSLITRRKGSENGLSICKKCGMMMAEDGYTFIIVHPSLPNRPYHIEWRERFSVKTKKSVSYSVQ